MSTSQLSATEPYHSAAAETVEGQELAALVGLKRFILHTEKQIQTDTQHFFQEFLSDLPAFGLSADAIHDMFGVNSMDALISEASGNVGNFTSALCAALLMYGLDQQKRWAKGDLKEALRLYIDFRDDQQTYGFQEASKRLESKMLLSGLQYTGLPDNIKQSDFDNRHAVELAKSYGIFSASEPHASRFKHRVENVGRFLTSPNKVGKTLDGFYDVYAGSARFLGKLGGGLIENAVLSPKIVLWDATNGIVDSGRLTFSEIKRKRQKSQVGKDAAAGVLDMEKVDEWPLLFAVQHKMDMLTEEQKSEVQTGLQHLRALRRQAHATRRYLGLQIGYMGAQGFQGVVNALSDDPHHKKEALVNLFGVMAAMGPLSGFSKHLRGTLNKIESQRAHEIERVANIVGIVAENGNTPAPETDENEPGV